MTNHKKRIFWISYIVISIIIILSTIAERNFTDAYVTGQIFGDVTLKLVLFSFAMFLGYKLFKI